MTQKEEIIKKINFMNETSFDELKRIYIEALSIYFKSSFVFGFNSKQSKDCLKVSNDMKKILKKEKVLLSVISKYIDYIDLDETVDVIDELDLLNDNTYTDYIGILSDIEESCLLKDKNRLYKSNNTLNTLINNPVYNEKVNNLIKKKLS